MGKTLINFIKEAAKKNPHKAYAHRKIGNEWYATTYEQMDRQAEYMAAYLINHGFKKGDRLAILAEGSPEWINVEFSALYAGMITVPLSIKLTTEEILFRMQHAEIHLIAVSEFTIAKLMDVHKDYSDFTILWLDPQKDPILKQAEISNFPTEKILFLQDMISEGKKLLENPQQREKLKNTLSEISEHDCATLSYSSGTTGNPKGVMLSHKNYIANTEAACKLFKYKVHYGKTRSLLILPCDHAFGHTVGIYFSLMAASSLYFLDSQGGATRMIRNIPDNIIEVKPDYVLLVPALANSFMKRVYANVRHRGPKLEKLFKVAVEAGVKMNGNTYHKVGFFTKLKYFFPWFFLGKLLFFPKIKKFLPFKLIVSGGALCDRKIQEFFWAIGIPFYQGYGMSESSPIISSNRPRLHEHKIGTCGRLFPGVECKVVRIDGTLAAPNEIGEVAVRGDNVMLGYFKNPEETVRTIRDGWLFTGDMGFLDKDNFLSITGREKALLISKDGEKYNPEEMEEAICTSSQNLIAQCLLYCDHRPYVVALLVFDDKELLNMAKKIQEPISLPTLNAQIAERFFQFKTDQSYEGIFPPIWTPNTYRFANDPFETNSTMKVVRYKAFEKYKKQLEYLYTPEGSKPENQENINFLRAKLAKWALKTID